MLKKECTLSMIKPDAVSKNVVGSVISRFEISGILMIRASMLKLTIQQVVEFYYEHKEKHFFNNLIDFMISGPVFIQVLTGCDVIRRVREIMGNTNPINALAGTIRSDYGKNCTENAIHGSDSNESAAREIEFFFKKSNSYEK